MEKEKTNPIDTREWLPMDTAPYDGTEILLLHDPHYVDEELVKNLKPEQQTIYDWLSSELKATADKKAVVGFYGQGDTGTWEASYKDGSPDWWFANTEEYGFSEFPLQPIGWLPIPKIK